MESSISNEHYLKKVGIDLSTLSNCTDVLDKFVHIQTNLKIAQLDLSTAEEWCNLHKANSLDNALHKVDIKADIKKLNTEIAIEQSEIEKLERLINDFNSKIEQKDDVQAIKVTMEKNIESMQQKVKETSITTDINLDNLIRKVEQIQDNSRKSRVMKE